MCSIRGNEIVVVINNMVVESAIPKHQDHYLDFRGSVDLHFEVERPIFCLVCVRYADKSRTALAVHGWPYVCRALRPRLLGGCDPTTESSTLVKFEGAHFS